MSQVGVHLKAAKEALSKEDYATVLKECKTALQLDKNNYHAWLFAAVATSNGPAEKREQAETGYRRAIDIDPKIPTAWQGLVELFAKLIDAAEKNLDGKKKEELCNKQIQATASLLEILPKDHPKRSFYLKKRAEAIGFAGEKPQAFSAWKEIKDATENPVDQELAIKHMIELIADTPVETEENHLDELIKEYSTLSTADSFIKLEFQDRLVRRMRTRLHMIKDEEQSDEMLSSVVKSLVNFASSNNWTEILCSVILELYEDDRVSDSLITKKQIEKANRCLIHRFSHTPSGRIALYSTLLERFSKVDPFENTRLQQQSLAMKEVAQLLQTELQALPNISGWVSVLESINPTFNHKQLVELCQTVLRLINTHIGDHKARLQKMTNRVWICLAHTYRFNKRKHDAESLYNKVLANDPWNINALKGEALIQMEMNLSSSLSLCDRILECSETREINAKQKNEAASWGYGLKGWIYFLQHKFEESCKFLILSLERDENNAVSHYRLGRLYWDMGGEYRSDKSKCQREFILSAKFNPLSSDTFAYLGKYYNEAEHDTDRAMKCWIKSLSIDPLNELAGVSLSILYNNQGHTSLANSISRDATARSNKVEWAWKNRAFSELKGKQYKEALGSFQILIRIQDSKGEYWEGIGHVYRLQGQYAACIKAYEKAVQLNKHLYSSLFYLAIVKSLVGEYDSALSRFAEIKQYYAEMKGSENPVDEQLIICSLMEEAINWLGESKKEAEEGMSVRSGISEIKAIVAAKELSGKAGEFSCVWKLLGDVLTDSARLSDASILSSVPAAVASSKSPGELRTDRLKNGLRAYNQALSLVSDPPDRAPLLFDCAINLYLQSLSLPEAQSDTTQKLLAESTSKIQEAIQLKPDSEQFWHAFAVINKNLSRSQQQHALITSLRLNRRYCAAWCSLAYSYLTENKLDLARNCIVEAQSVDPDNAIAWTVQGLIEEAKAANVKTNEISLDEIDHLRSAYRSVLEVDQSNIVSLNGLSSSCLFGLSKLPPCIEKNNKKRDRMIGEGWLCQEKYCKLKLTASGLNTLAVFQELRGVLDQAVESLQKAQNLLANESRSNVENTRAVSLEGGYCLINANLSASDQQDMITANFARVLCKQRKYDESLSQYEKIRNTLISISQWRWKCESLTHIANSGEKALEVIKHIHTCFGDNNSTDKSLSKQWLASVALYYENNPAEKFAVSLAKCNLLTELNMFEKAKPNIVQLCKEYPSKHQSWKCMFACAIKCKDYNAALSSLTNLRKFCPNETASSYILESRLELEKGVINGAKSCILKAIHIDPDNVKYRYQLLSFTVHHIDKAAPLALANSIQRHEKELSPEFISSSFHKWADWTMARSRMKAGRMGPSRQDGEETARRAGYSSQRLLHRDPSSPWPWLLTLLSSYSLSLTAGPSARFSGVRNLAKIVYTQRHEFQDLTIIEPVLFIWGDSCVRLKEEKEFRDVIELLSKLDPLSVHSVNILKSRWIACWDGLEKENTKNIGELLNVEDFRECLELANIYVNSGLLSEAIHCYEKSVTLTDSIQRRALILTEISSLYFSLNDNPKSQQAIDQALSLTRYNFLPALLAKCKFLFEKKDWKSIDRNLTKCINIDPLIPTVNRMLLEVHSHNKEWKQAESDALFELDINRFDAKTYYLFSLVAKAGGAKDKEKKYLTRAAFLNPSYAKYAKNSG